MDLAILFQSINTESVIYFLLGLLIILVLWIIRLEIRLKNLLIGQSGKSLEGSINSLRKMVEELQQFRDESIDYLKVIEMRLKRSVQAIETIRFNPFKGTGNGGNQSFSTAIVSEKGDGVVITGLYSRDRISIFSKPLKKFVSEFETTAEEKEAICAAKDSLPLQKKL